MADYQAKVREVKHQAIYQVALIIQAAQAKVSGVSYHHIYTHWMTEFTEETLKRCSRRLFYICIWIDGQSPGSTYYPGGATQTPSTSDSRPGALTIPQTNGNGQQTGNGGRPGTIPATSGNGQTYPSGGRTRPGEGGSGSTSGMNREYFISVGIIF